MIPANAIVTLITNLSVNLDKNKIFQKLSKRNRVGWSMSFDNVGDRLEYVRHGASWNQIQENLTKYWTTHKVNITAHILAALERISKPEPENEESNLKTIHL